MKYNEIPDITLKNIIEAGFIKPNTNVYAAVDDKIVGILNNEGAIVIEIDEQKRVFPFPSGAARAIVKTSVNGWKFWRVLVDGVYVELSEIKKRYLETI